MTEVQRQKLLHFFNTLDSNGNGILETEDFELIGESISDLIGYEKGSTERLLLKLKAHEFFIQILKDLDKKEAELTSKEWLHFYEEFVLSKPNDYVNLASTYLFSLFDQDSDGFIDKKEYLDMFKAYGLYLAVAMKAFDLLDINLDGKISGGELVKAFEDFFLSSDPDAPGNWIFGEWKV